MKFDFDDEALALAAAVAAVAASDNGRKKLSADSEGSSLSVQAPWWPEANRQFGLDGLAIAVEHGGRNDFAALAAVLRETGRSLAQVPLLSTAVLAVRALELSTPCHTADHILSGIVAGEVTAAVAVAETARGWTTDGLTAVADLGPGGHRVTGRKVHVIDGASADVLIVAARAPSGPRLFVVDSHASGVTPTVESPLDPSRPLATVSFDRAPARLLGTGSDATDILEQTRDLGLIGVAAEQLGGAEACLAMAIDHVRRREQGGRTLGSRQVVRNACVTMLGDVESARSAVHHAVWAAQGRLPELAVVAAMAGQYCSDAFVRCARMNLQLHGGRGFINDNNPHRYLRRALSSSRVFLDPVRQRELLVRRLLEAGEPVGPAKT